MVNEIGIFAANLFIFIGACLLVLIVAMCIGCCRKIGKNTMIGKHLKIKKYINRFEKDKEIFQNITREEKRLARKTKSKKPEKIEIVLDNPTNEIVHPMNTNEIIVVDDNPPAQIELNAKPTPPSKKYLCYTFNNLSTISNKIYKDDIHFDNLKKFTDIVIAHCHPRRYEIILRISSPGGYAYQFENAYTNVMRLREHGFILTAVVDDICASGGYMLACACNQIYCSKYSSIGSVGVIGRTHNYSKLINNLGIEEKVFKTGKYKAGFPTGTPYTDEDVNIQNEDLQETLAVFKEIVTNARANIDIENVVSAKVWYGETAEKIGLVDGIKSYDNLIEELLLAGNTVYLVKSIMKKNNYGFGLLNSLSEAATSLFKNIEIPLLQKYFGRFTMLKSEHHLL